jgi:hypothetical protein
MSGRKLLLVIAVACLVWSCAGYKSTEVGTISVPSAATDISGYYAFTSLEESCVVSGKRWVLSRTRPHQHPPEVACDRFGKAEDFLPLPREAWAHPHTTIALDASGEEDFAVKLYLGEFEEGAYPYDSYHLHPAALEERVDMAQIPFSGGSAKLDWSMSKDEKGLHFILSDTEKGVFLLVPMRARFEMTCLLPATAESPRGKSADATRSARALKAWIYPTSVDTKLSLSAVASDSILAGSMR